MLQESFSIFIAKYRLHIAWNYFFEAHRSIDKCKPFKYIILIKILFNGKFYIVMFDSLNWLLELDALSTLNWYFNLDICAEKRLFFQTCNIDHFLNILTI